MVNSGLMECSFLIPLCRDADLSDGEPHAPDLWHWFTDELWIRFGVVTIAPGDYSGFYADLDTGERVDDRSRKFILALPAEDLDLLRGFLIEACELFAQKCIYLSVTGKVEFVDRLPLSD